MSFDLSRRQVLKLITFLSAGTAAGSVPFISKFFANKANAQTGTVYVRESIATFAQSPSKIAALRRGIQVMKSRPSSNPTSWIYQANIHGTTDQPSRTAWNTCAHGSFFFLSWHRMYLYYFERILRAASGDSTLVLPYWNYSDFPAQRVLPEPFRNPADEASNPLFVLARASGINDGTTALANAEVSYAAAFRRTNFFHTTANGQSFGGRRISQSTHFGSDKGSLERVPHDQVHVVVGGNNGWMSSVELAARDPIFWLHHANIDRLWESWLQLGGGRANPTNDSDWMNDRFTFFDENGSRVTLRGRDIINTVQQLNYRYDNLSSSVTTNTSALQRTDGNTQLQELTMSANNQEMSIVLTNAPLTLTAPFQQLGARALTVESALTLNVEGVEYNPRNSIPYQIYINLPQGATPDPSSPYYAGRLALFALRQGGTFSLDLTDVVSELQQRNLMTGDSMSVTFVPPPSEIPQSIVREGSATQLQGAVRFNRVTITRQ